MINMHRPPTGHPPEDLDGLLRRFFRSEMPDPWPAPPQLPPAAPRKRQVARGWFRPSTRFALAASVALFVIGYLALAGRFPTGGASGGTGIQTKDQTAQKFKPGALPGSVPIPPRIHPLGSGGQVESRGEITPGRTIILQVKELPGSGGRGGAGKSR